MTPSGAMKLLSRTGGRETRGADARMVTTALPWPALPNGKALPNHQTVVWVYVGRRLHGRRPEARFRVTLREAA